MMERTSSGSEPVTVLVTGGAGYVGSVLVGMLLNKGYRVIVIDDLFFGGESLLAYWQHPSFKLVKGNVADAKVLEYILEAHASPPIWAVVHLAAIEGFPACQAVGRQVAWYYNVVATERLFEASMKAGVERFLFASTYGVYGTTKPGEIVNEDSPRLPYSLYTETKIVAEDYLLEKGRNAKTGVTIYRLATLYGISPRPRFDTLVNQFVVDALTRRKLIIYQRGFSRAFLHVQDACEAILLALEAPAQRVRGEVFNVGSKSGQYTKDQIANLVAQYIHDVDVTYSDLSFGGAVGDIVVSFAKIKKDLGFQPKWRVEDGIIEVRDAILNGVIKNPLDSRYRNAQFIVQ